MPAIKDIQWNFTTSTTGTTIQIPVPSNVQNDLLIVVITADTYDATGGFTANGTSQGWAQIHQTTNTALQYMAWKLASASEPASYTFTSTDSETYNGCIISIEDINTTNPFGSPAIRTTSNQAAASKFNMPTVVTNVANSLILYAFSGSNTGVPSILEGPVVGLLGADGTAESTAIGWGFKAATGTTSATVGVSNVATGAGVSTTLQIAPPDGGATIIPAYPQADASVYIDPINGTTAYNGNTAIAATADTNFGTTIGGLTTSDATLTAVTDAGINSFHSVARLTSVNNLTNPSGAELILAAGNRLNVTGKNILCHVGPQTEGQLQRFSSVSSTRGIWFGMRSNTGSGGATTGYEIFQVYGAEKGFLRHQPIVINSSATSTRAVSGTLDTNVVTSFGFWVSGTGVTTTAWDFASLWLIDTVTICGGTSTAPVSVPGIELAAARGKERRSVILQGSSQLIAYQPLQFGDGTSPIYLDLEATSIEFPRQFNLATKDVQYNSIDNYVGLTYFAAAGDTINHSNASISSGSKYHWRIASGSSASATYNFSGLLIINAGDVQLRPVTTFTDMSFDECGEIVTNGASFTNNSVVNSTAAASLSATFTNLPNITGNSFVSDGSNHAVQVPTVAGTTNITWNNTLSGYVTGTAGNNVGTTSGTGNEAIYITGTTTSTINITVAAGATIPSIRKDSANVTVNITANQLTFTISNIKEGTEVRAYTYTTLSDPTTYTEFVGAEIVGATPSGSTFNSITYDATTDTYTASVPYDGGSAIPLVIVAHNLEFEFFRSTVTLSGSQNTSFTVFQSSDRQYDNPGGIGG